MVSTLISFYGGGEYYHKAAEQLKLDCEILDIVYDIREIEMREGDWVDLCRRKIGFYRDMLRLHPDGILWVDVDTRIIRRPTCLDGAGYDFGAYLSRVRSLSTFDPLTGLLAPFAVQFTGTDRACAFVDHIAELEQASQLRATDDYFLQEGFRTFDKAIGVHVFAADSVASSVEVAMANSQACLAVGLSGNVSVFIHDVEHYPVPALDIDRQRSVLRRQFREAARERRRADAEVLLRTALRLDPSHKETALSYAGFLARQGRHAEVPRVLRAAFDLKADDFDVQKLVIEARLATDDFKGARAAFRRVKTIADDEQRAYLRSRDYRLSLEERATAQACKPDERPAMWWMESPHPGNLGDILGPYLVEALCGIPPRFVPRKEGMLTIGSIIKFASAGTAVWGSGTPRMTDRLVPDAVYHAVRGPLTRALVEQSGGTAPELYGDAAMLLPLVYPRPTAPPEYRLGLIRHLIHDAMPLDVAADVRIISLARIGDAEIEAFLAEVLSCDTIISTSLHGLIVPHAYGIPTRRAVMSGADQQISGDGTKFTDHYLAFGIDAPEPIDLSTISRLDTSHAALCIERVTIAPRYRALLDAAPFSVLQEMLARADRADAAPPAFG